MRQTNWKLVGVDKSTLTATYENKQGVKCREKVSENEAKELEKELKKSKKK